MTQTAETVELLDARIKGKKKFSGAWHPGKPNIMFYPDTTYRLHPACYDPERFDLVTPGAPPAAPAAPAPVIQSKELPPRTPAPPAPPRETTTPPPAPTPTETPPAPPAGPVSKELPTRGAPRKLKGGEAK